MQPHTRAASLSTLNSNLSARILLGVRDLSGTVKTMSKQILLGGFSTVLLLASCGQGHGSMKCQLNMDIFPGD